MTTLDELITQLQDWQRQGYGDALMLVSRTKHLGPVEIKGTAKVIETPHPNGFGKIAHRVPVNSQDEPEKPRMYAFVIH